MGKVKWALIAAAVVAIVVILLATQGVFRSGGEPDSTGSTAVDLADESVTDTEGRSQGTSTGTVDNGNASDAGDVVDGGETVDTGKEDDTGEVTHTGEAADRGDAPDTGEATGTGEAVDTGEAGDTREAAGTGEASDTGESAGAGEGTDTGDTANTGSEMGTTPDTVSDIDAELTGSGATSSTQADGATSAEDGESDSELQQEAESFVRQLAEPSEEPLQLDSAQGFVGADRRLTTDTGEETGPGGLPAAETVEDAVEDEPAVMDSGPQEAGQPDSLTADTPDQPADAVAGTGGDSARESAEAGTSTPVQSASAGSAVEDTGVEDTAQEDAGVESARPARADLPLSEEAPVTIADLLGAEEAVASDAVFYVHTVQPSDNQGIWGIVHDGILKNFAAGVAVHRGERTETYQVDIPRHADEPRSDSSSSYLGRLIYQKSRETYVYNYRTDRLGRNPDLIYPGQEIVIVSFSPEELIEIYKHFVGDG